MTALPKRAKESTVNVRISDELKAKVEAACQAKSFGPFKVTVTSIVERGIELALRELEELKVQ